MVKGYEAKGDILDETYVSIDQIWNRVSSLREAATSSYYTLNGVNYEYRLSQLSKEIVFQNQSSPKSITFVFSNDDIAVTKTITVQNTSYPLDVSWTLTPLKE